MQTIRTRELVHNWQTEIADSDGPETVSLDTLLGLSSSVYRPKTAELRGYRCVNGRIKPSPQEGLQL